MHVKGIIFDINGTLSDIQTNEWHDDVYRVMSNLLSYQGIVLEPNVVKDLYFQIMKEQRAACEWASPRIRCNRHLPQDHHAALYGLYTRSVDSET